MTPVIEILQEFLFLSVVFKLVDNIVNGALSNRSKLYDTIIETQKLADSRKAYHRSSIAQLFNLRISTIICVSIKRCHIVWTKLEVLLNILFESKFRNITYLKSYTLKTEVSIEMGYIAFSSFQATSYRTLQTFVAFR